MKRCPKSVEVIVEWQSPQLSVATGGHCLAIISTSNELPGTLLGNAENSLASTRRFSRAEKQGIR